MPTRATTVDGLKLPNPFVIGSGPPGTYLSAIQRAFREGWGGVIAKTVSPDASRVVNVTPRQANLHAASGEVIGWENINWISGRAFQLWIDGFKRRKDAQPPGALIASVTEEFHKDAWVEISERCQKAGVDAFELNVSCPHGLPERRGTSIRRPSSILPPAKSATYGEKQPAFFARAHVAPISMALYHYAWLVGFCVAFVDYVALRKFASHA